MARKIIIDTDPGIDDAMAIFYALHSPELEVVGLTSIFGNAATDICTRNALSLLEIAGRTDIPVAAGAARPLAMPYNGPADFVHGADGQGNVPLPPPAGKPVVPPAAHFLAQQILQVQGEITLVALGPLTNIALLLLLYPGIEAHILEIVLMGGSAFAPGNVNPGAEANIWNDPEAADIVFGAACPVTMVGLDVTESTWMPADVAATIGANPAPEAQHLARILPFYLQFYEERFGERGMFIHDSSAISYLLRPEWYTTVRHPIRVETQGLARGKTWVAQGRSDSEIPWQGRPDITICVKVQAEKVMALELERLRQIGQG
ncbi:MAG: nucleoside hydrolase [Anaerolineae bacterium]|jgi:uridine nucleosidase|nr:nucleoside hydrolase [Anaerolineae bacterium]